MIYFVGAITAVLAIVRVMGDKSLLFKDFAHFWVAGLFAVAFFGKDKFKPKYCLVLAISISLVELACFLYGRFHH